MIKITDSEEETENLGHDFASGLNAGDFVALYGELGSGKTAFARGICRRFNCLIEAHSPTFNIINFYPGSIEIAHIDLYRIDSGVEEIGWSDILGTGRVVIVEWPEKAKKDLPQKRFDVFFKIIDPETREIRIEKKNDSGD